MSQLAGRRDPIGRRSRACRPRPRRAPPAPRARVQPVRPARRAPLRGGRRLGVLAGGGDDRAARAAAAERDRRAEKRAREEAEVALASYQRQKGTLGGKKKGSTLRRRQSSQVDLRRTRIKVLSDDVKRALTEREGDEENPFVRMTNDLGNLFDSLLGEFMQQLLRRSLLQVLLFHICIPHRRSSCADSSTSISLCSLAPSKIRIFRICALGWTTMAFTPSDLHDTSCTHTRAAMSCHVERLSSQRSRQAPE